MVLRTVIYHPHDLANSAVLRFFMILEILYKKSQWVKYKSEMMYYDCRICHGSLKLYFRSFQEFMTLTIIRDF